MSALFYIRREKMIVFHTDLDNTLIYSCKHEIGDCKRCVEMYQGREVSFMTEQSVELLKKVNRNVLVVPTTTRTIEQYERIDLTIGRPEYALVCNGGILLEKGEIKKEWYQESLNLIKDCQEELEKAQFFLEKDSNRILDTRLIEQLFVFTKSEKPRASMNGLKKYLDEGKVDIFAHGVKLYVLPKKLTKGMAVKRFQNYAKADRIFAAGDSIFDLSMAEYADVFFAPESLKIQAGGKKSIAYMEGGRVYSEELLQRILRLSEEKKSV